MMIAYQTVNLCAELSESNVFTLVIENQGMFCEIITDIVNQFYGLSGNFVLSKNYTPLDMRKHAEIITQLVPFTVNQKDLLSKVYSRLKSVAVDERMYMITNELMFQTEKYIYELTSAFEGDLSVTTPSDITGILKMFDVRYHDENMTLSERLLEYMTAANEYKGERVFFIVNLRSYINDSEAEMLFKEILLRKITLICIESTEHSKLSIEQRVIIDKEMCII